jgi:uncharacterized protein (TIGR02996 family)
MNELDALLGGIVSEPLEETRWLVLADWLQENDDHQRSELLQLHRRLLTTCCEPANHPERVVWQSRIVELIAAGIRPCIPQKTLQLPGGGSMTLSFIPPGSFLMGGTDHDDEKPIHKVTLTKGFFVGVHPVTQAQWKAVMGTDPSHFKGDDRPVESVSWDDSQEFCARLTAILKSITVELPSEAMWEYACRAGTTTEYYTGDGEEALKRCGWFWGNSESETRPVGQLAANAWGLYDVHGNVWEWCQDRYGPYEKPEVDPEESPFASSAAGRGATTRATAAPRTVAGTSPCAGTTTSGSGFVSAWADPVGPTEGSARVLRGGSWYNHPSFCRAAYRNGRGPTSRTNSIGFRVSFRLD